MSFLSKATLHFFSQGEQWDEQFLFKTKVRYPNLPLISSLIHLPKWDLYLGGGGGGGL